MKKRYLVGAILLSVILSSSVDANVDFSKDESKYQKMCRRKSGYRANKSTCEAFETYLKKQSADSDKLAANIQDKIKNTKNDIVGLLDLIKKNQKLIDSKKHEINSTKENISATQKDIIELEEEIVNRLALMQEISGENFVVDFIMSSTSLEDFLIKMDGISAINESNNDIVKDLGHAKKQLTVKKKKLDTEKVKLDNSQKQQGVLLKDYQSKQADLFVKLEEEHKKNSVYNSKLSGIDLDDPVLQNKPSKPSKPSKPKDPANNGGGNNGGNTGTTKPPTNNGGWIRPVKSAWVSATAWYYSGGGWHPAVDLANNVGTPIVAPANGVLLATGWDNTGYGNYMVTAHQMGKSTYTFIYAHMSKPGWGGTIRQGQQIGSMGSTGNSSGPHAHVEVFKHTNKTLKQVVNKYKNNGDLYFGLGYRGIGSCKSGSVCRLVPQDFFNLKGGQNY